MGAVSLAEIIPVEKEKAAHSSILAWEIPCLIPGLGRSPGEGSGDPLQCSCLESSTDRGAWQATVHGAAKSRTRLSDFHFTSLL